MARSLWCAAVACLVVVAGCGGGDDKPAAEPATVTVTSTSMGPTLSPAQGALQDAACANYPPAVSQAIQENKRLRRGKTDPVILMSIVWNASAEKVAALQPPQGLPIDAAFGDVHSALLSLKQKADDYAHGVFDIAYELEAFKQADLAVRRICR